MYFIIIIFVDFVLYLIIICIYIDYIVIEKKRERMEWKKKEKGLVLVGYYGNLYKKLNVCEFFVMVIFLCYFYVWL